jgi:probable phosphoglycerate mutase
MSAMSVMSVMSVRLILVRHGEAGGNRELRYLGSSDVPLTTLGEEQVKLLAEAVRVLDPMAIYASPLGRARQTAEGIAAATGLTTDLLDGLREMDFGAWEMLTHAEAMRRTPDLASIWAAGGTTSPPGGESLADVTKRIVSCANLLAARHDGQTVALVSHVGPIKALVCAALGLPPEGARRMWLDTASISLVEWGIDEAGHTTGTLRLFNATAHLHALPRR